jgi:hypothetical protein
MAPWIGRGAQIAPFLRRNTVGKKINPPYLKLTPFSNCDDVTDFFPRTAARTSRIDGAGSQCLERPVPEAASKRNFHLANA